MTAESALCERGVPQDHSKIAGLVMLWVVAAKANDTARVKALKLICSGIVFGVAREQTADVTHTGLWGAPYTKVIL